MELVDNMDTTNNYWARVSGEVNLVSLPDIYWRLKQILDSKSYVIGDIAELLRLDPGLSLRLLRIVNSAYFGFAAKISSVDHAVSILGSQQIHDLVLATSIADTLGGFEAPQLDVQSFWQRSVYRAIVARDLAAQCNLLDSERLFVTGLTSSIGHLVMYQALPQQCQQALQLAQEKAIPLYLSEREIFGFDHAMVGAALMLHWNLPDSLVEVVRYHLEPDLDSDYRLEIALLHLATRIGGARDAGEELQTMLARIDTRIWQSSGLDDAQCLTIADSAGEQFDAVLTMFFPNMNRARA